MSENMDYTEVSRGDVRIWINEGGAITLKSVDSYGDPVELTEEEALEIAQILQRLVAKVRE